MALVGLSAAPAGPGGGSLCAQATATARVRTAENFRRQPNGELLGRLDAAAPLVVVSERGDWLEVDVEGWMWARSLQVTERAGFDLVVAEAEGENLRAEAGGTILGRLERGTLLEELERRPGWIHVRRRGWMWAASVVRGATAPAGSAGEPTGSTEAPTASPDVALEAPPFVRVEGDGAAILSAPDGDTLARAAGGAEIEVLAREGNWARVRVEGWTWMPRAEGAAGGEAEAPGGLTPEELKAAPEAHRGRVVAWILQFVSLERAERVRTDFYEGEPFLLCRYGGPEGSFVYVAVPPERLTEVEGLVPLESLAVTGRVRTGSSALTGTPILDLLAMERVRDAG